MPRRNKERRSYLRPYASDYINTTQKPRFLIIEPDKPEGDNWFNNHGRVRSVIGPKNSKDVVLNNTWTKPIPKTIGLTRPNEALNLPPRLEVKQLLHLFSGGDRIQGVETFNFITLFDKRNRTLKLGFSGNNYCFVEEQHDIGFAKRSCIYHGKQAAMAALKNNKILWQAEIELKKVT